MITIDDGNDTSKKRKGITNKNEEERVTKTARKPIRA